MTGSLQTKNGRIYMVIHYKDVNGKPKNKWIATHLLAKGNMKAAKGMLEKWLREHQDCDMNCNNLQLADYLQKWIDSVQSNLERSTVRGYREKLKNHIIPYFKDRQIKLIDLKIRDLETFYWDHLLNDKKLSPQTVRHCHRIISTALNDAIRKEMISSNPASLAKCPRVPKYDAKFLNLSQIQQLVELFVGTPIEDIVKLISIYGLRRSEALGLCWDKVDFEKNQFTICRTKIQATGGDYLKDHAKNNSSCRTLPMTADVKKLFLRIKQKQEKEKRFFDEDGLSEFHVDMGYVFAREDGAPFTSNYVSKYFHKRVKESILPQIRLHDLRHSVASNLLSSGFSLVEIQAWLGHSQPSTTLNFYFHIDSAAKRNIKDFFEKELEIDE